jgi:flagellar basal-body rod modification protein FlgD
MIGSAMPVNVTQLPTGTQLPSASGSASGSNTTLNQNDFFRLMTTQLESQDPLNPMNSDQYAAELAAFSTANGVQQLQSTVSGIGTQLSSVSGIQASNLVGHSVAVSGDTLAYTGSGSAQGAFNLPSSAANVTVTVTDSSGNTVDTISLGAMNGGMQGFTWNGTETGGGTAPAGYYTFQVNALGTKGNALTPTSYTVAPVAGVTLGGQNGPTVNLADGLGSVTLNQIYQIY